MPSSESSIKQAEGPPSPPQPKRVPNKLILCFDGTGNTFSGSNADTNVVKLLNKLDRNAPGQYHYYQSEHPSICRLVRTCCLIDLS